MSKSLGTIIAEERKKKGLSQEKFAEKMKCTRQMVSRWELDDAKPRTENIKKICEVLDIPIEELMGNKKKKKKSNISNDSNPIKVKKFNLKKMFIIIGIIVALLATSYGGYSIYKYALLNNIYSKVAQYKNLENYYFKEKLYNDKELTNSIEIWYKNGLYKIIETSYFENMQTFSIKYMDLNNKYRYIINEDEKTYNQFYIADTMLYENGAYMYNLFPAMIIGESNKEITNLSKKINLIFSKRRKENIILRINNEEIILNKDTFLPISDTVTVEGNNNVQKSNNEYSIEFNIVKDEDVKIPDYYNKIG